MRKIVLFFLTVLTAGTLLAQNRQVSGTVNGPDGERLAGATVTVRGTRISTVTNAEGYFNLEAPVNSILQISAPGMETADVQVGTRSVFEIAMNYSSTYLEDVIVVAFGTATREAFTGSAGVIKSTEIEKRTSTNVLNSMAGQLPGVQIRSSDGQPGSQAEIRIRGFTSLNAGNDPLIVVDGSPFTGNLSAINPADIESLTVLKDASATALYGARAANGVIMVTTKRASNQEAVITFDAKWGVGSRAAVNYDYIDDPAAHYELTYAGVYNYQLAQGNTSAQAHSEANSIMIEDILKYNVYETNGEPLIGIDGKINPNATLGKVITGTDGKQYYLTPDDWEDNAFHNSLRQEYNISVNGGTERASYFMSLGYLDDNGIVDNSSYKRITARVKADYQAKKWLKVGANVSYANTATSLASGYDDLSGLSSGNIFAFTSRIAPIYPLFMRDGETKEVLIDDRGFKMYDFGNANPYGIGGRPFLTAGNPLAMVQLDEDVTTGNMLNFSGFADITFMEGLKLNLSASSYLSETRENWFTNPWYGQYATSEGIVSKRHRRYTGFNFIQMLSYTKRIGLHNFDVMAGHENYDYRLVSLYGSKDHMFTFDVHELNSAVKVSSTSSYATNYNTEGYFGRAQYDYDGRFFGSMSFRRDATSRFHPDHRWGNFWSIGAAWIINKEAFMEDVDWVDMLKLKASYGTTGNDQIGDFRYVDTYEIVASNDEATAIIKTKGNENITWETNANLNIGVEFEVLKSRLFGEVEFYRRGTRNMLFARPLPESSGYSSYYDNIGDMRSLGVEVSLTGVVLRTSQLNLSLYANITTNANKITRLPPERVSSTANGFASSNYWIGEGLPMYTWYMPQFAGVDPDTGESLWYYTPSEDEDPSKQPVGDRETTKDYSEATSYALGSAQPDAYGGFGFNFYAYGFDLSVNFDYQIGGLTYDSAYAYAMRSHTDADGERLHVDLFNAWTVENPNSNIPRFQYKDEYSGARSDRFLTDASFLNLQNINLGYTLPASWTSKIKVNSVRVYCSAENIMYWSKRKGLDTRQSWNGSSLNYVYSPIRTISGGLQLTF